MRELGKVQLGEVRIEADLVTEERIEHRTTVMPVFANLDGEDRIEPTVEQTFLRFRAAQAKWLDLDPLLRLAWAKERRVCQAARVLLDDGRTAIAANLHATSLHADERVADAELRRAAVFVDALAAPDEPILLCGDFNIPPERSRTVADLEQAEWGFSPAIPGIDQVLVRGLDVREIGPWAEERRRVDGRLVSDHTPVEAVVA